MTHLTNWQPLLERTVLQVLHEHGVPNAVDLSEKCGVRLQGVVNSIRNEAYDRTAERLREFIEQEQATPATPIHHSYEDGETE